MKRLFEHDCIDIGILYVNNHQRATKEGFVSFFYCANLPCWSDQVLGPIQYMFIGILCISVWIVLLRYRVLYFHHSICPA